MTLLMLVVALIASPARATGPDLSITRSSNTAVYGNAYTAVSLTITNQGTASAPTLILSYAPGQPTLQPLTNGYVISPIMKGHSGRGGGYTRVGWTCTQSPAVALQPGASTVVSFYVIYPLGTYNESWTVSAGSTAQLNLVSHTVSAIVVSSFPPIPSAPTGVSVAQSGDNLSVAWIAPSVGGTALTSSTVTATPIAGTGTTVLYGTVNGTGTSATVAGVSPTTTYSVTVQSSDSSGAGPASTPVTFTTQVSMTPPGAPTGVHTWWISTSLAVAWTPPTPGDSPVDDYQVSIAGSDGTTLVSDAGTSTEDVVSVDSTQDSFSIKVRAHNAAGWGNWSPPITQSGL